tara:strand:- start:2369 stop:3118 length:750 start_codon:yes stop_codon:yes gene_type:complete
MGTSKSYKATVQGQPQWGELSSSVTRSCDGGLISTDSLSRILGNFVNVVGGASISGRGGSKIAGRSGIKTAKKLGGFIGGFVDSGGDLSQILSQTGLTNLTGKSVEDVIDHLIEFCSGPASTIDDRAAKEASRKLLEEIAGNASTFEELQESLQNTVDQDTLEDLMVKYFGYYVLEHLSIMFYEHLVTKKGKSECSNLFRQIEAFIIDRLDEMNKTNPLNSIDWGSDDADRLIKNIQQDVLTVFENHEG